MLTLTLKGKRPRDEVTNEVRKLVERAKYGLDRWSFPYLWVVEGGWRGGKTRVHCHMLVPNAATDVLCAQWALGFVSVEEMPTVEERRRQAGYITKDLPRGHGRLLHSSHHKPKPEPRLLESSEVLRYGSEMFGGLPARVLPEQRDDAPPSTTWLWD